MTKTLEVLNLARAVGRGARRALAMLAFVVAIATALSITSGAASAATPASCYTCTPQCVPTAREWSGINIPRVTVARDIPEAARRAGFQVKQEPPTGRKSVLVVALGSAGHALAVTKAEKKSGKPVKLVVSHSNADCKCTAETANATYSGGKVRFTSGMLKGRSYDVLGFVWK